MLQIIVIISIFWTYDNTKILAKLSYSLDYPILAAFVLPKGSVSQKINQTFSIISDILDPFTNIIYTIVDCTYSQFCETNNIKHYPTICLLRTFSRKYWKCTDEIDISGVSNFLKYELTPNIQTSSSYWHETREKILNGGTMFSINTDDKSDIAVSAIKSVAIKYKPYGVSFSLRTSNSRIKTITAHHSTKCKTSKQLNPNLLDDFVKNNAFSVYHQYSHDEFSKGGNFILYAGYEKRFSDKNKMIDQLVDVIPCNFSGKIGFASLTSERWIADITGKYNSIEPFIVGVNVLNKCYIHIQNLSQLNNSEFYSNLNDCVNSKKLLDTNPYRGFKNDAMFLVLLGIIGISGFVMYFYIYIYIY